MKHKDRRENTVAWHGQILFRDSEGRLSRKLNCCPSLEWEIGGTGNLQSLYIQIDTLKTVAYNLADSSTGMPESWRNFHYLCRCKAGLSGGTVKPIAFGTESKHQRQSADT